MRGSQAVALRATGVMVRPSLLAGLLAAEALLVVLYFVTSSGVLPGALGHRLGVLFDLDAEQSVGAWFSASQLLVIGLALWTTAERVAGAEQPAPWFLRLGGAGFVFLSLDEAAAVHEALSRAVYKASPSVAPFGHEHSAWVVLYVAAAALLLAFFWPQVKRFWRAFPSPGALGAAGAAVVLAGATGLESLGYLHLFVGHVEVALEETLEMVGATLILLAALGVKDAVSGSQVSR